MWPHPKQVAAPCRNHCRRYAVSDELLVPNDARVYFGRGHFFISARPPKTFRHSHLFRVGAAIGFGVPLPLCHGQFMASISVVLRSLWLQHARQGNPWRNSMNRIRKNFGSTSLRIAFLRQVHLSLQVLPQGRLPQRAPHKNLCLVSGSESFPRQWYRAVM